ncbi:hypothetical protein ACFCYH_20835 [Streptomyces sp. NPDC056400]|uniref:hypothetical protein n=1 Tax=Streptomyces sp. NPDC056400 TaxID=3345808 RepID=UPI0035D68D75
MTDLVDLINQSQGAPISTWLPHVVSEMFKAEMSCDDLMEWAAGESPQAIVQCVVELDTLFPKPDGPDDPWSKWAPGNHATVSSLLRNAARIHGAERSPIVVVGLRRAGVGSYVDEFLSTVACWFLAPRIRKAVVSLEAAQLHKDARSVLRAVGGERQITRVIEVVDYFTQHGELKYRDAILDIMADSRNRFMAGIESTSSGEVRDVLISRIPPGDKAEYADALSDAGYGELAEKVNRLPAFYNNKPPF